MLDITSVADVAALRSAPELQDAARSYNWDDGLDIPMAIADHPQCDLAVALELSWLSEALSVYTGEAQLNPSNKKWIEFCRLIIDRILSGHYKPGTGVIKSGLSAVQQYRLRKRGVPEILVSGTIEPVSLDRGDCQRR